MGTKVEFPTELGYSRGTGHRKSGMSRTPLTRERDNDPRQSGARFGKDVAMLRPQCFARLRGVMLSWGLLITVTCLTPALAPAQSPQNTQSEGTVLNHAGGHRVLVPTPEGSDARADAPPLLSSKQRLSIMRANFEKSKSDAAELAALARGLREELNKPNVNVLSAQVINRAERIEKLAKRIREETKGY
jgi:hypothetical protein